MPNKRKIAAYTLPMLVFVALLVLSNLLRKIDPPSLSFGAAGNHDVVEALVAANTATTTDNFLYKITVASQG